MSKERDYIRLSDSASGKNVELVSEILRHNTDLDITHYDGEFFTLSIKSGSVAITRLLIQYYETVQLRKLIVDSSEYNILRFHFKEALETATEGRTLSDDMKSLLSKYIDFDHDSVRDESCNDEEGLSDEHHMLEAASDHSTNSSLIQDAVVQLTQAPSLDLSVWLAGQPSGVSDIDDHLSA